MSELSLPIIDISPFLQSTSVDNEARQACGRDIFTACTTTGFFYLTNHGIPTSMTDAVLSLGRDFFLDSSPKEKIDIMRRPVGVADGDGARGWQPVRDNITGGKRDWQEAVDFYRNGEEVTGWNNGPPYEILMGKNLWPQRPEELRKTYEEYVERMLQLGKAVLTAMGVALGGEHEDVFTQHTRNSFWGMRLIGYAPIPESGPSDADGISCGAHTDYGCVTLLLTDDTKGALHVKSRSGKNTWINADPIHGAFVVNIGDMMERWTNGLWKSTLHRVVHHGNGFRVSLPFFMEPDFGARIQPLKTCIDQTGGVARYGDTIYGQHLMLKVLKNFYTGTGVNVAKIDAPAPPGSADISTGPGSLFAPIVVE